MSLDAAHRILWRTLSTVPGPHCITALCPRRFIPDGSAQSPR